MPGTDSTFVCVVPAGVVCVDVVDCVNCAAVGAGFVVGAMN